MNLMKPAEKVRLLNALEALAEFVQAIEVETSCASCEHWDRGQCKKYSMAPPEEVQKTGCPEWELSCVPF